MGTCLDGISKSRVGNGFRWEEEEQKLPEPNLGNDDKVPFLIINLTGF